MSAESLKTFFFLIYNIEHVEHLPLQFHQLKSSKLQKSDGKVQLFVERKNKNLLKKTVLHVLAYKLKYLYFVFLHITIETKVQAEWCLPALGLSGFLSG